ncbi:hypothetical protein ACTXT7_015262 [Hymenolepis weldensis]
MPAATQTDARLLSFDEEARPRTKDIASEANVLPAVKQVRHRASNTENHSMVDQETNTRPRGINVSITFGGDEQLLYILMKKKIYRFQSIKTKLFSVRIKGTILKKLFKAYTIEFVGRLPTISCYSNYNRLTSFKSAYKILLIDAEE